VAKVQRDWALLELEEAYGLALGSGYPSDPLTVQFLQQIFDDEGNAITKVPPFVRKTWAKKSFGQQTA
jgi:ribonuclease HII